MIFPHLMDNPKTTFHNSVSETQNERTETQSRFEFPIEIMNLTPTTKEKESTEKDSLPTDRLSDISNDIPDLDAIMRDSLAKDTVKLEWHPDVLCGNIDPLCNVNTFK